VVTWTLWRLARWGANRSNSERLRELKRYKHSLWVRKGVLLGYAVVIGIPILAGLELTGAIDTIPAEGDSELIRVAQVMGAFGPVALTLGLILLYDRQAKTSEQQYQPYLIAETENRNTVLTQFVVRNTGEGFAYKMEAEWAVADDERTWKTQSLAPGDSATFPIVLDENGRWILDTQMVRDHLEENDASSEVEYTIRCEDQFGIPKKFTGEVDLEEIAQREEANEIWEKDPMNSLASSLSDIESSVDQIASDINDRRDEHDWEDRWAKDQAIIRIVGDREEISVDVLRRIVKTSVAELEYRLSELEEAGYLNYRERQGIVETKPGPGNNHTLSDFP